MPEAGLVDVDGEVGALSGPHGPNLQLHLVVLLHLGFHHDTKILLWVLLPDPGQQGQVDVDSAPGIRPELHLVGLDLGHRGLAGLLVHGDVVDPDQGLRLGGGGGSGQVDAQLGLGGVRVKEERKKNQRKLTFSSSRLESVTLLGSLKYSTE